MSKLKDFFFPALAGLDYINDSKVNTLVKMELLSVWNNPHMSRKALTKLKEIISELEGKYPNRVELLDSVRKLFK